MNAHLLYIFQLEVVFQCKAFHAASVQLDQAMTGGRPDGIFIALQGMLLSAANLSKLLWGSKGPGLEAQREPLRLSVGIDDSSCLRDRKLRNDFEHFDERVDDWHYNGHTMYVGRNVGGTEQISITGFDTNTRFQHFDSDTGVVTFWEHSVSILELGHEVVNIFHKAQDALDRFPPN